MSADDPRRSRRAHACTAQWKRGAQCDNAARRLRVLLRRSCCGEKRFHRLHTHVPPVGRCSRPAPFLPPTSPPSSPTVSKKVTLGTKPYLYTASSANLESLTAGDVKRGCVNDAACLRVVIPSNDGTDITTSQRLYMDATRVFPVYTLIVNAVMGVVTSATWDDGCYFCSDDLSLASSSDPSGGKCVDTVVSNGTVTSVTSTGSPNNGQACLQETSISLAQQDIKIYIGWTGTDANGRAFTSAGERFSRYKSYAWMNVVPPKDGMKMLAASALDPSSFTGF